MPLQCTGDGCTNILSCNTSCMRTIFVTGDGHKYSFECAPNFRNGDGCKYSACILLHQLCCYKFHLVAFDINLAPEKTFTEVGKTKLLWGRGRGRGRAKKHYHAAESHISRMPDSSHVRESRRCWAKRNITQRCMSKCVRPGWETVHEQRLGWETVKSAASTIHLTPLPPLPPAPSLFHATFRFHSYYPPLIRCDQLDIKPS